MDKKSVLPRRGNKLTSKTLTRINDSTKVLRMPGVTTFFGNSGIKRIVANHGRICSFIFMKRLLETLKSLNKHLYRVSFTSNSEMP